MSTSAKEKLILALDVPNRRQAGEILCTFYGRISWVKIGLQLFCAEGPRIVRDAREAGFRVFLDLKLHDIPNTVANTIHSLAPLGPELLTVHILGGPAMLEAAANAARSANIALLGVTLLTSIDPAQAQSIGLPKPPAETVLHLAQLAHQAGLPGIVASPRELPQLRQSLPPDLLIVTPGIRPHGATSDDQKRTLDPASAIRTGASYLVIGRPLYAAPNPLAALDAILFQIDQALQNPTPSVP